MFKETFTWAFNAALTLISGFSGIILAIAIIVIPGWIVWHLYFDGIPKWIKKLGNFIKEQYKIFMMPKDKRKEYKEISAQASIAEKKRKFKEEQERLELLEERWRKRHGY